MGEAIARFHEMALTIRRVCDERHSQPRGRAVKPAAAKKFAKACREHFLEHEQAGMNHPARYIHRLCELRAEAEQHPQENDSGCFIPDIDLPGYYEWIPEPFAKDEPDDSEIRKALLEARKEAAAWGPLFPVIEARLVALDTAANMLQQYAAATYYQNRCSADEEADRDYIARHEEFADALDALAPFIEEPPTAAGSTFEKQTGSSRGGRPPNDEALARDLLAGWKAFEPEDGRKTKERYLAQRPDVRVLKTEEARQRKIASLRVALDSALHLRREKTKQRRQARG